MKLLVIDNGTGFLLQLLRALEPHETTVVTRDGLPLLGGVGYFDAVVLSGSPSLNVLGHEREYAVELGLISGGKIPVVGICLGFELIARAFGLKLELLPAREKGVIDIRLNDAAHPVFAGIRDPRVYESHRWAVKECAPPLVTLAHSADGIEVLAHETLPIFGFQFHPEMLVDETQGDEMLRNALACIAARKRG